MATTDKFAVKRYIVEKFKLGRYGLNDATQSDATTLSDASQFGGFGGDHKIDVGCEVLIHQNTIADGGGTDLYDLTRVSDPPSHAAGQITLVPTPSVGSYETPVVADNDTEFIIWYIEFRDEDVDASIDKILGEQVMWQKLIRPLTSVADGDMRASAEAAWTTANAADAKAAASFPLGERVIVVTASSNNGYTSTGNLPVEELMSYYLEVTGLIDVTGDAADAGTLAVQDITNAAALTIDNKTIDRFEPEILRNPAVQMPSGCEQVDIRLTCDASGDVISWANLIWRKNEQTLFTLEDKPFRIHDIGRVRATSEATWGRRVFENMAEVPREVVQLTEGLWQVQLKQSVAGRAVFYEEWVAPGTLATNAATTIAPVADVAALVATDLLEPYALNSDWTMRYKNALEAAGKVIRNQQSQRSYVNTDQRKYYLPAV